MTPQFWIMTVLFAVQSILTIKFARLCDRWTKLFASSNAQVRTLLQIVSDWKTISKHYELSRDAWRLKCEAYERLLTGKAIAPDIKRTIE